MTPFSVLDFEPTTINVGNGEECSVKQHIVSSIQGSTSTSTVISSISTHALQDVAHLFQGNQKGEP
jgi:hypothetical protein